MSPAQPTRAHLTQQTASPAGVETSQPQPQQSMNMTYAQNTEAPRLGMRGGDRGGACPGRFCFCVPCPIPCDFCII